MTRSSIWTVWTVVGFLLLSRASAAGATAPSDQVLPSTTKHYLSIDLARVAEDCKKAHYAQVLYNPANLGLTFSLAQLLNNEHGELFERFGIRWTDLIAATNGEASCAIVQSAGGKHATVLLLDVSGRQEQARRLLAGAAERLKQRQAQPGQRKLGDAVLTTFTLPAYQSQRITRIGCVVNGDLLIVSDGTEVIEGILARQAGRRTDSLSNVPAYQAVMRRSGVSTSEPAAIRWFSEPLAWLESQLCSSRRGNAWLALLKKEGFDAIKAVGGCVLLGTDEANFLSHTAVYAPRPYRRSMRMLSLSGGTDYEPSSWVPAGLSTYATVYWDLPTAFRSMSTLVDSLLGPRAEGTCDKIIDSLRSDPYGPRVDLRRDLIGQLGPRITIMGANPPINARGTLRLVIALDVNDEKVLTKAICKCVTGDSLFQARQAHGCTIWEVRPKGAKQPRLAFAVHQGHLFLTPDVALLDEVLEQPRESLASRDDFQRVNRYMDELTSGQECCFRLFVPAAEAHSPMFPIRTTDRRAAASSVLGEVLTTFGVAGGSNGKSHTPTGMLPGIESLTRHLGPAGIVATTHEEGWTIVGFSLKKLAP